MDGSEARPRREEYPDLTRAAVVDAARQLFAERGFFQTKVSEIAKLSRVSPATVYAQCGGKQGLLRSLMDGWTQTPVVDQTVAASLGDDDADVVMRTLTHAYLEIAEEWGDVIQVILDVAPHDHDSKAILATAQGRHSEALEAICQHLEHIGALRPEVDAQLAAQIITYYYGLDGLLRARATFGWSLERSHQWLSTQVATAVLASA